MGLIFNLVVWWWGEWKGLGYAPGVSFLSGYLVEKSLSMDNIFVFVVIFRFFGVPLMHQYRVLFAGILSAIIMRLTFILAGATLIPAVRLAIVDLRGICSIPPTSWPDTEAGNSTPKIMLCSKIARRFFCVTRETTISTVTTFCSGQRRVVCYAHVLVLLVIESTDVLFAFDSVPAILGITQDAFIIFTSNIFAILGLRALYFLLAGVIEMFRHVHYGLAGVLGFVGLKMIMNTGSSSKCTLGISANDCSVVGRLDRCLADDQFP